MDRDNYIKIYLTFRGVKMYKNGSYCEVWYSLCFFISFLIIIFLCVLLCRFERGTLKFKLHLHYESYLFYIKWQHFYILIHSLKSNFSGINSLTPIVPVFKSAWYIFADFMSFCLRYANGRQYLTKHHILFSM